MTNKEILNKCNIDIDDVIKLYNLFPVVEIHTNKFKVNY